MPSSLKTTRLGLNQWVGNDKPKRNDWNTDNKKVDKIVVDLEIQQQNHENNNTLHTSVDEKKKWNNAGIPNYYGYTGDGTVSRFLNLNFSLNFGIIYAKNQPLSLSTPLTMGNSGVISPYGSSYGVNIASQGITVTEQVHALPNGYKTSLNKPGVEYICMYW